ncbi:hypothetical protein SDRG_08698 [Saprolegnia diclina VS20]|uniref:Uncharacterized protein n=1 Tax=Saprolegnia diclina (strain VS20) TaxID=1156394 RepID=T0QFU0_SAPDV|nr:hypothetical protein SDRG_08698 [Saprolegnia diclina VS20]EQC33591.1 hypothetical protein SDRG_08698 [Saprolegnia diclina VS20]|eukprot:XP_008612814.1 hypothetical protein SDRG_08698 [Saprolegnia diclina VS20]
MAEAEIIAIAAPSEPIPKKKKRRRQRRKPKTSPGKPAQAKKHGKKKLTLKRGADVVQRPACCRCNILLAIGAETTNDEAIVNGAEMVNAAACKVARA